MSRIKLGGPKDFWNRLKSISVSEIAREADRPLNIAVVGAESDCFMAIEAIRANPSKEARSNAIAPATAMIHSFSSPDEFPAIEAAFDFIIDVGLNPSAPSHHGTTYRAVELGGLEATLDRIYDDRPDLMLALARNFPRYRPRASQDTIQQTAMTNAEFSLITGVASAFPLFELVLPANALSDILVLTKNQVMMALSLAAIYGLEVNYKSRMKELTPILVNAFSWRAIARELVGAVPMVGFVFRAMISYAGTVAVGKAAQLYYECGETITRSQAQRMYREAYAGSREKVRMLSERIRSTRRAIPAASEGDLELDAGGNESTEQPER